MNGQASEARFLFELLDKGEEKEAEKTSPWRVVEFTAQERISSPFKVDITLVNKSEVQFDEVIGKVAQLTILSNDEDRRFIGIINEFSQTGNKKDYLMYRACLVPPLWLLSLEHDCRIHQNKSAGDSKKIEDIVGEVLQEGGMTSDSFAFRLQEKNQYEPWEFCVQYRETDLDFISRLLETEGIFYFFEHKEDKLVLVFGNSKVNYQPIRGRAEVPFHKSDTMVPEEEEEEVVYGLSLSEQVHTGKVSLRDFSFEKPSLMIEGKKNEEAYQQIEYYDYTGRHPDTKDAEQQAADRLANIRLEEAMVYKRKGTGSSTCPRFTPGYTFALTQHEKESFNQEYLLVEVLHKGSQPQVLEELSSVSVGTKYSNEFISVPSGITFRPERKTKRPVVEGLQTAIVVGPEGEEIYTDEQGYGRVKVKFHWDRRDVKGDAKKRSCWLRVGQFWAGSGWGSVFIPRVGDEVLVHFLEGDPDQPLVVGSVYNEGCKPLYPLPDEKTKSTVKTKSYPNDSGFNEIRFEDKKGSEEIFIHAQKDQNEVVENNMSTNVGANQTLTVQKDRTKKVDGKEESTVKKDCILTVTEGNRTLTVSKGDSAVTVDQGSYGVTAKTKDIIFNAEKAKLQGKAMTELLLQVGEGTIKLEPAKLTLAFGANTITLDPAGVTIMGTLVKIN